MHERGPEVEEANQQELITKVKERKQLYLNVFDTPDGQKVLEDLERHAFIHKTTLNTDSLRMVFNEGQRSMVLHIKNFMKIDIEKTAERIREQQGGDNV